MPHTFEDIIKELHNERRYQKAKWGNPNPNTDQLTENIKPIESYITYITHHLQHAITSISSTPDTQKAIEHIHKITALGIKCMQDNGTYIRTGTLTTNQRNHQTYDYSQLDIDQ